MHGIRRLGQGTVVVSALIPAGSSWGSARRVKVSR